MKKSFALIVIGYLTMGHLLAQEKEYKTYLVSTAHFDTQWNWDVRESIDDYLHRTMVQNFWLIERFPNYVFNFESAQKYAWMKEYYPQEYEKVKHYIRTGRWNVVGSTWEATDPNIPSSESFFRNVLLGQTFYKNEFGVKSNDIYLPDCFGFGYTLPTIAAHCGLKGFSTQKLQWRKNDFYGEGKKMPFPIGLWQGLDGSRIMAVCDAGGYGTSYYYDDITTNQRIINRSKQDPNKISYTYYGVGDRGGSPTLPSVWSMEDALKNGKGPVEVISARAGQIYEDFYPFENHPELPVWNGELLMDVHGVGCYTSQAAMKLFNRRNEQLANAAERASVVAELLGGLEYPADELRNNWKRFLWHQFHDDLTGTSIPQSYTFSWNDELISQTRFAENITTAVGAVSRALNTKVKGIPVVVYNPLAVNRKDVVKATVEMPNRPSGIHVTAPDGKRVPAQLVDWKEGKADILFAAEVAPLSFSVYEVRAGKESSSMMISDHIIENSIYKVTLDVNGDIASIWDKRYKRELVQEGKPFRLVMFTDNLSTEYPAWELYKKVFDGPSTSITRNVNISVEEQGPVRSTLKVERVHWGSRFVQYISLTEGANEDCIEIRNEVDWRGEKALLKAEFPMTVSNEQASYDLGIGYIKRGNNEEKSFEVLGHQWADLTDAHGTYGISILNDCKYGWDKPDDQTLRLTLFHTPLPGKHYRYQDHQDHGHHTFRYAIVGHEGDVVKADIAHKADGFNQPLMAFTTQKHEGPLGRSYAFVSVDNPQIAVKAVKKAEDGNGYIVRINEVYGSDYRQAVLEFSEELASVVETNGIEEDLERIVSFEKNKLYLDGTAFQPRTFRVIFKRNPILEIPRNHTVELPYNAVALTVDEFNRAGDFDKQGNSLAAELMPKKVVSDGIEFDIQNDPAVYNYVRANGDTIILPQHHNADKLFVLATSIQGDRLATFKVDNHSYEVKVPYYSGFYGQWGWNGESEGYIKDASIGYLADHRHSARKGNDSYTFAYLYKICLDIPKDARQLFLPKDAGIAVFAVTLTDNPNYQTKSAWEMRALPYITKPVNYIKEPIPFYRERSAW